MHKSWFSAASSSEATEYEKLAVDEEFVGDRSEYKWKRRFQAMGAAYAITILCLVAAYFFHGKNKIGVEWNLPTDVTFGHIPRERVLFTPEQSYSDIFTGSATPNAENGPLWDTLQPRGGGFIAVTDARELGLTGGFPLEKEEDEERTREGNGISMFHQIHCLVAIRSGIQTRTFDDQHLDHCLDYLRQSIMCTGDTTLEKVAVDESGKFQPDIDGWGTVHECRSWHMLLEFAERQRVKVIGD